MAANPLAIMNAVATAVANPKQKAKKAIAAKQKSGAMPDDSATDGQPEPDTDDMPAKPAPKPFAKGKGVPAKPNF